MSLKKKTVFGSQTTTKKSALHTKVVGLVRKAYPNFTVLEEAPIEVIENGRPTTLFVDILVRNLKLAIECHGEQHFKFVKHFHGNDAGFNAAKSRDQSKKDAVLAAGFSYMMIPYEEEKSLTISRLLKGIGKAIRSKNE